ncbi:Rhodanese- sulfurtransferase [Pleurotus ostreatus]|nr:Rhodanese- sulfurtransferase [Pleurotus ostreatus]
MDVSGLIASHAAKFQSVTVEKDTPPEVDVGFLIVTDLNPIDEESYGADLESHLQKLARDGTQALISKLFSLPTTPSPDGPVAQLPPFRQPKYHDRNLYLNRKWEHPLRSGNDLLLRRGSRRRFARKRYGTRRSRSG